MHFYRVDTDDGPSLEVESLLSAMEGHAAELCARFLPTGFRYRLNIVMHSPFSLRSNYSVVNDLGTATLQ